MPAEKKIFDFGNTDPTVSTCAPSWQRFSASTT
jgi:hypothetical protein